jgi:hypothetical protein
MGGASAGFKSLLASKRHLVFDQQAEPLGMIEGAGFSILVEVLEGLRHAVKTESMQQVEGRMGEHMDVLQLK